MVPSLAREWFSGILRTEQTRKESLRQRLHCHLAAKLFNYSHQRVGGPFPAKIEPIGLSLVAENDPVLRMLFQPTILDRIQVTQLERFLFK